MFGLPTGMSTSLILKWSPELLFSFQIKIYHSKSSRECPGQPIEAHYDETLAMLDRVRPPAVKPRNARRFISKL
jgi:hypothetical protein